MPPYPRRAADELWMAGACVAAATLGPPGALAVAAAAWRRGAAAVDRVTRLAAATVGFVGVALLAAVLAWAAWAGGWLGAVPAVRAREAIAAGLGAGLATWHLALLVAASAHLFRAADAARGGVRVRRTAVG